MKSICAIAVAVMLAACDGAELSIPNVDGGSTDADQTDTFLTDSNSAPDSDSNQTGSSSNRFNDRAAVSRFLSIAGLGGTSAEIDEWVGQDAAQWLQQEFQKPHVETAPAALEDNLSTENGNPTFARYVDYNLLLDLLTTDSPLRQRATFALSQILVVGGDEGRSRFIPAGSMYYRDVLDRNAFGNYRTLLEEVTYAPVMARWLTYLANDKGDPTIGREPDENYARELLQLFTIGLHELNQNGTQIIDDAGNPIPTYDNEDVAQLARVFTGFSYDLNRFRARFRDYRYRLSVPLKIFPRRHDTRVKNFLNVRIPANTQAAESLVMALDGIFNHSNVAPFIGRQLIQRFTASNPSNAYVARVSSAFNTGIYVSSNGTSFGTSERGDLEATLAAILLDQTVFASNDNRIGKLREPLLSVAHWFHTFKVQNLEWITMERRLVDTSRALGMVYMGSPSVFNFYRPGYVAPRTRSGDRNLTVPELQIATSGSLYGYIDLMSHLALESPAISGCIERFNNNFEGFEPCNFAGPGQPLKPDYDEQMQFANDPGILVDHLNELLLGGRISGQQRQEIIDTVSLISINPGTADADLRERVQIAVLMFVTSPTFSVVR